MTGIIIIAFLVLLLFCLFLASGLIDIQERMEKLEEIVKNAGKETTIK